MAESGSPRGGLFRWTPQFVVAIALACCWAMLVWASGRGFDRQDEGYYLLALSDPDSFRSVTDYGYVWAPLYRLLGGDIAGLRIAGAAILQACGLLFAAMLWRFAGLGETAARFRIISVAALSLCAFWQYTGWLATPNYNILNLCGLLLFFAGLMGAGVDRSGRAPSVAQLMAPIVLVAAGLALTALAKPTTFVAAAVVGVAWIVLVRPPRPLFCAVAVAVLTGAILLVAVLMISGGVGAYLETKAAAFNEFQARPNNRLDAARIVGAVTRPLAPSGWGKIAAIAPPVIVLFSAGLIWAWTAASPRRDRAKAALGWSALGVIGVATAWLRAGDGLEPESWKGFLAWYLVLAIPLAVSIGLFAWPMRHGLTAERRRALIVAVILLLTPVVYSVGTNALLVLHMSGAIIFWAAAAVMVIGQAPADRRPTMLGGLAVLCVVATLGVLVGTLIAPKKTGWPLSAPAQTAALGPDGARLAVEPETARYYGALRAMAQAHGFAPRTPVIDLAGYGPGGVFVLGGRPAGDARNLHAEPRGAPVQIMNWGDAADLRRAWVVTSDRDGPGEAQKVLASRGLNFPDGYEKVGAAEHARTGWRETLWKPRIAAAPAG
jgi:hypothetical protein